MGGMGAAWRETHGQTELELSHHPVSDPHSSNRCLSMQSHKYSNCIVHGLYGGFITPKVALKLRLKLITAFGGHK